MTSTVRNTLIVTLGASLAVAVLVIVPALYEALTAIRDVAGVLGSTS